MRHSKHAVSRDCRDYQSSQLRPSPIFLRSGAPVAWISCTEREREHSKAYASGCSQSAAVRAKRPAGGLGRSRATGRTAPATQSSPTTVTPSPKTTPEEQQPNGRWRACVLPRILCIGDGRCAKAWCFGRGAVCTKCRRPEEMKGSCLLWVAELPDR